MFLVHYLVHPAVFGEVGKKGEEVRYHLGGGYLITKNAHYTAHRAVVRSVSSY